VDQKCAEEAPHDRWALADLRRCGENVELIKATPAPRAVDAYVQWSLAMADAGSPAFLGSAYTFEILSMKRAGVAARNLQSRGAVPADAVQFLSGHGDADVEHVAELVTALRRLGGEDVADVMLSASVTRALYPQFFRPAGAA
jgi:hypothetical protein